MRESVRGKDEATLKGYALQITAQLPDQKRDAILVLEYAKELVLWRNVERSRPEAA